MFLKKDIEGEAFRLRSVKTSDADFIIQLRNFECADSQYLHKVSLVVSEQEEWINNQICREGDYYFIIENRLTKEREGTIGLYGVSDGKAEWGRWVLKKGSLASIESVILLFRFAFKDLGLRGVFCRTIEENRAVVHFHDNFGEKNVGVCKKGIQIGERIYQLIEHRTNLQIFEKDIYPKVSAKIERIFQRNLKSAFGEFSFDHIGIATKAIESEIPFYTIQGYVKSSDYFDDQEQGVRGVFFEHTNGPKLELLENLEGLHTLDKYIRTGTKMYHQAFYVQDFDKAIECLKNVKARMISEPKNSVFFKKRISFFVLKNMDLIEIMER